MTAFHRTNEKRQTAKALAWGEECVWDWAEQLEMELCTMTREHANALGTAAAEAAARKRNLVRAQELERELAQTRVMYEQVILGQRQLQRDLEGVRAETKTVRDGFAREFAENCKLQSDIGDLQLKVLALAKSKCELLEALEAIVTADRDGELCNDQIAQAIDAIAKARNTPQ